MRNILAEHELDSPLCHERKVEKALVVVIGADRGLCGSLTSNLLKRAHKEIESSGISTEVFAFGKKAVNYFQKRSVPIFKKEVDLMKRVDFSFVKEISSELQSKFSSEAVDRIDVVYNEFFSPVVQKPRVERLLPLSIESQLEDGEEGLESSLKSFKYEPEAKVLVRDLLPMLIDFQIYRAFLESFASEHAARMAAMDSASNNARDMIGRLTLKKNRARQAAITKELMEIIGGAEAIA